MFVLAVELERQTKGIALYKSRVASNMAGNKRRRDKAEVATVGVNSSPSKNAFYFPLNRVDFATFGAPLREGKFPRRAGKTVKT